MSSYRRDAKPLVLLVRVKGKRSPMRLHDLVRYCDVVVVNLFRPVADENVLKIARRLERCDVAVFTSSIACSLLYKYGISVRARYYIAIGEDTRDSLFYLFNIPREHILLPEHYDSDHIIELLRELVLDDVDIRVVHVYRSKHADYKIVLSSRSFSRRIIVRELRLYRLVLDNDALHLVQELLGGASVVVLLSESSARSLRGLLQGRRLPVIVPSERVKRALEDVPGVDIHLLENVSVDNLIEKIRQMLESNAG